MNKELELPLILELLVAFCIKYGIRYQLENTYSQPVLRVPDWGFDFYGGLTPGPMPDITDVLVQADDIIMGDDYSDQNGPNATYSIIKPDQFVDPTKNLDMIIIKLFLSGAWASDNALYKVDDFLRYTLGNFED